MVKTKTLMVEGMTCANCAQSVTKAISNNGGQKISVDFISGEASFEGEVDVEIITGAIQSVGYKVLNQEEAKQTKRKNPYSFSLLLSAFASIPLFASMVIGIPGYLQLVFALIVIAIGTKHFGKTGLGSIKMKAANMDVLVLLGAYISFGFSFYNLVISQNTFYFETSAIIITLVLLGKWLEKNALSKSQDAIKSLKDLIPNNSFKVDDLKTLSGNTIETENLKKGDLILVREGEKIPVDAKVFKNQAYVDESLVTGESIPIKKEKGEMLLAGSLLVSGNIVAVATAIGGATYVSKVVELVKKAQREKPNVQVLADKISAVFVPIVISIAFVTFFGWWFFSKDFEVALVNAIAVLVISCPCAMGLATPTAVSIALGTASKNGIYIKNPNAFEILQNIKTVMFDKTGTLTQGNINVQNIEVAEGIEKKEVFNIIYGLEQVSLHPIAKALLTFVKDKKQLKPFINVKEIKGFGVIGENLEGNQYRIGKVHIHKPSIQVEKNKEVICDISLSDSLRPDTASTTEWLRKKSYNLALVSGDVAENCKPFADILGIEKVFASQKPEDKLKTLQAYQKSSPTIFMGDGINDAPVLTMANIGISPTLSTDVAINSADIVLNENELFKNLKNCFLLSFKTYKTIKQNLFWAFFYNTLAIPLAMLGFLNPMIAAGAMSISSLFVVTNSLRLRKAL